MKTFFKKLFSSESINLPELVKSGAAIVDVRSPGEFKNGHVKGSINIPLGEIAANLDRLKEKPAVILCCASGMRSSAAASELKKNGLKKVYNGGSWQKVNIQLKRPLEEE